MINLIEQYKKNDPIFDKIKKLNLSKKHPIFKIGDKISFFGGYNKDINYISTITGFDEDHNIYLLWDCFWSPIRHEDASRKIKILEN